MQTDFPAVLDGNRSKVVASALVPPLNIDKPIEASLSGINGECGEMAH
jgi:hypothetical protein